jgi:predicted RNA-binding protein with PUA-like domain
MVNYFLVKTDPDSFSIHDFWKEKTTYWDGVHNFQAINNIKKWKIGDKILIYHSIKDKKIMGLGKVIGEPHLNIKDPRTSWAAFLQIIQIFDEKDQISLEEIKQNTDKFREFPLINNSRLSVIECPLSFINWLKNKINSESI